MACCPSSPLSVVLVSITRSKPTAFRRCALSVLLDTGRMVEYRKSSHAIWDVKYHVVWITKYRFKVLRGEIAVRTRDLLRQICEGREVVIVQAVGRSRGELQNHRAKR